MADVHVLDEAQRVPRAAEVVGERDDLVVVHAALDDAVHLDRQAGGRGGVDPVEDARHGEVDVVQRPEGIVVERVEADGDPVQAGVRERLRLRRQQRRRSS